MDNQYRLVALGDSELVAGLAELVQQSNQLTGQMLAHLVELEQRMLHLELGFSSLFSYCVAALGMSEGTAGRRVTAARVCRRFPEAFVRVARGELHLCALCALAPHLNAENAGELFEACRGKTRRQIEELLAVRFPRPDVREQIRRLPERTQTPASPQPSVTETETKDQPILQRTACEGSAKVEEITSIVASCPAPRAAQPVPAGSRRRRELEPLSADRFGIHFTADRELRELIERARALASHRLPKGDLASLMKLMAASFVRQEEKRRFGIGVRPRRVDGTKSISAAEEPTPPGGGPASPVRAEPEQPEGRRAQNDERGRYLPVAVRREAHKRGHGRCSFVAADGRRCDAQAFVEFDHIRPFARRGAPDTENIRLLCKAHNLLHARNCFGSVHIAAKIAAQKRFNPTRARAQR